MSAKADGESVSVMADGTKVHTNFRYKLVFNHYDENRFNYLKAWENEEYY